MSIFTGVIVYLLVFWTVLFAVLPWGNKAKEEAEVGMAGSAPANPRIKQKFLITFIISTIIWGIVTILIHLEIIDFYAIARDMVAEDAS
jgi:predicted secreted protein